MFIQTCLCWLYYSNIHYVEDMNNIFDVIHPNLEHLK